MSMFKSYRRIVNGLVALAVAFVVFACSQIEQDIHDSKSDLNEYPILLNASQAGMTKIALEGNRITWEETDEMQLTAVTAGIEVSDTIGTSVLKWYRTIDEDQSSASFTGFITLRSEPKSCYFTYPVGETMTIDAVQGTVKANYTLQNGDHKPFLYGKSEYDEDGMNVDLLHLGAVLEIDVRTPGVTKVSMIGNNKEALSPIIINPEDEAITLPTEAVRQLTVNVQESGKTYLFVPPVNLENGFTLVFSDDTGSSYFLKSYSDGNFAAKRGVKIPITVEGDFEKFTITSDFHIVHAKNTDSLLTGTDVTFTMNKSGTPDRLIEEWGATLYNSKGKKVRSFSSKDKITGEVEKMAILDRTLLLDGGDYAFTPYYVMYGDTVSLATRTVTLDDPGVVIEITGTTSYSKYLSGDVDGANCYPNNQIGDLKVSTNLNLAEESIEYAASLTGANKENVNISNVNYEIENERTVAKYNGVTCTGFQNYTMAVTIKFGDKTYNVSKPFDITGLPYEADFTMTNPFDMNPAWAMFSTKYSNNRVVHQETSGMRSPAFHVPGTTLKVSTSCDCGHNVLSKLSKGSVDLNISVSASDDGSFIQGSTLTIGPEYYTRGWASDFKRIGYLSCEDPFLLTSGTPCLMYNVSLGSSTLGSNTFVTFAYKIEYAK